MTLLTNGYPAGRSAARTRRSASNTAAPSETAKPEVALQRRIGAMIIDLDECSESLSRHTVSLAATAPGASREELALIAAGEIGTEWRSRECTTQPPEESELEAPTTMHDALDWLLECLAWGFLDAFDVTHPPVPILAMIQSDCAICSGLALLPVSLGLYCATLRSGVNGSVFVVVDSDRPRPEQRVGAARALYTFFCSTGRATELGWPARRNPDPHTWSFTRCLLMPTPWVQADRTRGMGPQEIADHYCVPVPLAAQRLEDLAHRSRSSHPESLNTPTNEERLA